MSGSEVPDYTGHEEVPAEDKLQQLRRMALSMLQLDQEIEHIEAQKKELEDKRKKLAHDLIPKLMKSMGLDEIKLTGSAKIVVKDEVRVGKLPDNGEWKRYLKTSGDDGMIKREFTIAYDRDSTVWAETFAAALRDMNVEEHASVTQAETIHHSTLAAFLREEMKTKPEVVEIFGAFVQTLAKIQSK